MSGSEAEAIRETMALLAEFDMEQLKDMFNDDDKFDSFVKDIRQVRFIIHIKLLHNKYDTILVEAV